MFRKKTIFISYSVKDKAKVRKIQRDLVALDHIVWIYPESTTLGQDIVVEEKEGILKADAVLIMQSKQSNSSTAVQEEIRFAKTLEKQTGKKKTFLVNIDPELDLRQATIQICDLSNRETYTREFCRLVRVIENYKTFQLKHGRPKKDPEADNWYEINLWVEGSRPNLISGVDYYLHEQIACNKYTEVINNIRGKPFHLTFYTPHNEHVFAVINMSDGSVETLETQVKVT